VAPNQKRNIRFAKETGMRIVNMIQGFLYVCQSYPQLRGLILLVIGSYT
jgi:hypothetical protein